MGIITIVEISDKTKILVKPLKPDKPENLLILWKIFLLKMQEYSL